MRKGLFIISAVAGILCACEPESTRRLSGTGNIAIELGQSVLTRAEGAVDGSKMNNLHIWLVGSDGTSIKDYIDGTVAYVDDNTRYCTIDAGGATARALLTNVEKGNYTLYFVANLPSDFPLSSYQKGGTIDAGFKDRLLADVVDNQPPYDEDSGMPLSLVKSISVGAGTNSLTGELVRTCARIRLTVRNNTVSNTLILRKIALSADGNPSTGYLFPREDFSIPGTAIMGPFNSLELTTEGENTNIVIPHGETHTYIDQYMYETGPNGSVSLGFNIAGGLFADGVTSGKITNVISEWYETDGNAATNLDTETMYFIKGSTGSYYMYDNGGTLATTSITDQTALKSLLAGADWEKYAWKFSSASSPTTIQNVSTGNSLIITASGNTGTVSKGSNGSSLTMKHTTGSTNFRLYVQNNKYYFLNIGNTVTAPRGNNANGNYYVNLIPITHKTDNELRLLGNDGSEAEKYFDQTISSLNYIGKYGTPVPLEHIYRNQDVQIVVNVHYNPSSGVLYFKTTDWIDDDNKTTFD